MGFEPMRRYKNVSNIAEATNFLDNATFYSNHNIKVIPVRKQDKKPLTNHGWKDASDNEVVLQEWNKQFPNCNIGIPTGTINNIFVVDVDGENGAQSLAALENAYSKLNAPTSFLGGSGEACASRSIFSIKMFLSFISFLLFCNS